MKSRMVILSMLVLGMLLSTAGAGLAVSGISGNAAEDQYETPTSSPTGGGVLGDEDTGTGAQPDDEAGGGGPGGDEGAGVLVAQDVTAAARRLGPAVHGLARAVVTRDAGDGEAGSSGAQQHAEHEHAQDDQS